MFRHASTSIYWKVKPSFSFGSWKPWKNTHETAKDQSHPDKCFLHRGPPPIRNVFGQLERLAKDATHLSLRIRCLIRDVLDLRIAEWKLDTALCMFVGRCVFVCGCLSGIWWSCIIAIPRGLCRPFLRFPCSKSVSSLWSLVHSYCIQETRICGICIKPRGFMHFEWISAWLHVWLHVFTLQPIKKCELMWISKLVTCLRSIKGSLKMLCASLCHMASCQWAKSELVATFSGRSVCTVCLPKTPWWHWFPRNYI